ncbi:hypothetical protein ACWJKU_17595 [Methylocaldum sp. MU1018]
MRFIHQFICSIALAFLSVVITDVDIAQGLDDDSKENSNTYTARQYE